MAFTAPYRQHNYMGEFGNDAAALTFIQANRWDTAKDGTGNPEEGMLYYNTTSDRLMLYANGSWQALSTAAPSETWMEPVRVRAVGNITIATPGANIDGVAMAVGDRFLADQQATTTQDGIYEWQGAAVAATRTTDCAVGDTMASHVVVSEEGTANADKAWLCTNDAGSDVVGTDDLTFILFSNQVYTGGDGIDINATNVVAVDLDNVKRSAAGGSDAANNPLYLDGTNGLNVKVDASTVDLDGANDDRLYVPNSGITEDQLNVSVAGDGMTGGGGSALDVGANADGSMTVNADDIQVNLANGTTNNQGGIKTDATNGLYTTQYGAAVATPVGNVVGTLGDIYVSSTGIVYFHNSTTSNNTDWVVM
ncbi:MAG: hypothetical protein DRJ03_06930 [Chloroflexi bacterium]|nr:MAG: hypothetical protein DRJ03_06930 [Chloroflexota bacterium]